MLPVIRKVRCKWSSYIVFSLGSGLDFSMKIIYLIIGLWTLSTKPGQDYIFPNLLWGNFDSFMCVIWFLAIVLSSFNNRVISFHCHSRLFNICSKAKELIISPTAVILNRGHSSHGSRWSRDHPLTSTKRIFWQKIIYFMSSN